MKYFMEKEAPNINLLNIIPVYIATALLCVMSYWHASSEYGWRKIGLVYNLILGFAFAVLAVMKPMFG